MLNKRKVAAIAIGLVLLPAYVQLLAGSIVMQNFFGPFASGFFGLCGMVSICANLYFIKGLFK